MARIVVFLLTAVVLFVALYVARTAIVVALIAAVVAGIAGIVLWTMAKRALAGRKSSAIEQGADARAPGISQSRAPARRD